MPGPLLRPSGGGEEDTEIDKACPSGRLYFCSVYQRRVELVQEQRVGGVAGGGPEK